MAKRSSPRRSRALGGRITNLLNRIKPQKVTDTPTRAGILGGGVRGIVSGVLSLAVNVALSLVALVLIALAYVDVQETSPTLLTAGLGCGAAALGLTVLAYLVPLTILRGWLNLIVMALYVSAGVLTLVAIEQTGLTGTVGTYALIAGIFYVFIGGALTP